MEDTTSNNTTNSTVPAGMDGRAIFPVFVLTTQNDLPHERFAANVNLGEAQFEQSRYTPKVERDRMPILPVGSLVVLIASGICTHIGAITHELEDEVAPSCSIFMSVMQDEIKVNPKQLAPLQFTRPAEYQYAAATAEFEFSGGMRRLKQNEADHLRQLIGQAVPDAYLKTYWSETERQLILANAFEMKRHRAAVVVLLKKMEQLCA